MKSVKVSADGIVIWEVKTGEADRVITILTDKGLLTAYSRGSLRPKGKLTSPTAMLGFSNFELRSGRNMYNVDDALSKRRFLSLFTDAQKYALAVYFCELLKLLVPVDDDSSEFLSLMLNSLYLLNEDKKELLLVKTVFEMRVMTLAGYMPDLTACVQCGISDAKKGYFDIANGIWYCENCAEIAGKPINCGSASLLAMRHAVYSDSEKIFSFELVSDKLIVLSELVSKYVVSQTEIKPATLDFLNGLLGNKSII